MPVRGQTKNVAMNPITAKDMEPIETFIPYQIDLRNGHLADKYWEKRPGAHLKWTVEGIMGVEGAPSGCPGETLVIGSSGENFLPASEGSSATDIFDCNAELLTLTYTVSGGVGPYVWSSSFPAGTITISGTNNNTFSIDLSEWDGCEDGLSFHVSVTDACESAETVVVTVEGPICPEIPTAQHIDTGFVRITLAEFSLDLNNLVAYYGDVFENAITQFDLDQLAVTATSNGNGKQWRFPGVGLSGELYVWDQVNDAIVELNPDDLTIIRSSTPGPPASIPLIVTTNYVYAVFNSATTNRIRCFNKSDLSLRWERNPVSDLGLGNRLGGAAADPNENLWAQTRQTGLIGLHKFTPDNAVTSYDLSSVVNTNAGLHIAYDATNSLMLLIGGDFVATSTLAGTLAATTVSSLGFTGGQPVDGKIWNNTSTSLIEYQISDWSILQTINKTDISSTPQVPPTLVNLIYLSGLNCIHCAHGIVSGAPIGGVDRICLPC